MIDPQTPDGAEKPASGIDMKITPAPRGITTTGSMTSSLARLDHFSYMATHKTVQSTTAKKMKYTVRRAVRAVSIPGGVAKSYSVVYPDPNVQRGIDISSLAIRTVVSALVQGFAGLQDPSDQLVRLRSVIQSGTGAAPAERVFPVSHFTVTEKSRTIIPAWRSPEGNDDAQFLMGLDDNKADDKMASISGYTNRWSTQFACIPDTVMATGAVARALQDLAIATILKRTWPDLDVYCIDPRSVNYGDFDPKWLKMTTPFDQHSLDHMRAVKRQILMQLDREVAAIPSNERPTDPRAETLYAWQASEILKSVIEGYYPNALYVYCGGLVAGPSLAPICDRGSQALLMNIAIVFQRIEALKDVVTDVVSMMFDDPLTPEPYYADLLGEHLALAAQMLEFVGTTVSRCAIGQYLTCTSAADRYILRMSMEYTKQTYNKGVLKIGDIVATLLIPTFGLGGDDNVFTGVTSGLQSIARDGLDYILEASAVLTSGGTHVMPFDSESIQLAIDREVLGGRASDRFDPTNFHEMEYRTTESPNELCILEEKVISPYCLAALTDEELSRASAAYNLAKELARTQITGYSYIGDGFAPFRGNFKNVKIFKDTCLYRYDKALREYINIILKSSDSLPNNGSKRLLKETGVYIPLGSESVRRGGLNLENILVMYCIRITNTGEEMTITGPMVIPWTHEVQDMLQYETHSPIPRSLAPFMAR